MDDRDYGTARHGTAQGKLDEGGIIEPVKLRTAILLTITI